MWDHSVALIPLERDPARTETPRHIPLTRKGGSPSPPRRNIRVPVREDVQRDLEKVAKPGSRTVAHRQDHDDDERQIERPESEQHQNFDRSHASGPRGSPQQ